MTENDQVPIEEVKSAVADAYKMFNLKWGIGSEESFWISLWSKTLRHFSGAEILMAANHCVAQFLRPPVPVEFMELAMRSRQGKPMSDPIVSKLERLAYLIISSEEFKNSGFNTSELSDACLIAAAVLHIKSYADDAPDIDPKYIVQEMAGRANIFGSETQNWQTLAKSGKGYWIEHLGKI